MGTVLRVWRTIPMPAGASVGKKGQVTWISRGKKKTGKITGTDKVSAQSDTWTAQFVDETGKVRRVPTKTTNRNVTEKILAQYEKDVDRIKSGVLTREELDRAQVRLMPLEKMLDQYHTKMVADGDTAHHIKKTFQRITDLFRDCNIDSVNKIRRETIEQLMAKEVNSKVRAARTINAYVQAVSSFVEYMIASLGL